MLSSLTQMIRRTSSSGRAAKRALQRRNLERLERRELLSVSTPEGNWAAAGGGMQDAATGLVWGERLNEGGTISYSAANFMANNLVQGGYDDWRLPTKDELIEAISHDAKNYFERWGGNAWSATQGKWKTTHWAVQLNNGSALDVNDVSAISAVPVRGTRTAAPTQSNIRVFTENMTLTEGETARFSVVLDKRPTADVTIAVSSTDVTEGTSTVSNFVFTRNNWNVPQRANLASINDGIVDGDVAFQVVLANAVSADPNYNGRAVADIDVVVLDNVVAEFTSQSPQEVHPEGRSVLESAAFDLESRVARQADAASSAALGASHSAVDHVFHSLIGEDLPSTKRVRRLH